jgi:hypothetical protein
MRILDRLFGKAEEINGHNRCDTYLYRWIVCATPWFKAYLHHFVGNDWSSDLHDHPKRFISIGLKGWYIEETHEGNGSDDVVLPVHTIYQAPWIRTFPATHIHRLTVPSKNCWTLVIVLKAVREWGFWHSGLFIPWRDYVDGKAAHIADKMKDC